jgi:NADH:ubiquinone reductase (H+-translocating)
MKSLRIIILGGGFAGIRTALDLNQKNPNYQVTLINDIPYHVFHADLYLLVSAWLRRPSKLEFKNLSGTTNIPLKQIFKNKQVQIIVDKVTQVDLKTKLIKLEENGQLQYDYLVLALGSATSYFGIEGAEDFSHPFKTTSDALNVRNDIEERLVGTHAPFPVAIAGAGMTGVELAGEIAGRWGQSVKVTILEGSSKILPGVDKKTQNKALKKLIKLNVEIKTDYLIQKVEEDKVYSKDNEIVGFGYLIWTAGIFGTNLQDGIIGVEPNKKGQFDVSNDLSLENFPDVFVAGDLASFFDVKRDCYVAASARTAIEQGELVAKNIVLKIQGRSAQKYNPPSPVYAIPIGPMFALSNAFNFSLQGKIGWFLKRVISLKYTLSILPPPAAISTWWRGIVISVQETSL